MEHGMVSELRWTLLAVGALFVALLAWWERRRPRQTGGALERSATREVGGEAPPRAVHEPPLPLPHMRAGEPLGMREPLAERESRAARESALVELPVVELPVGELPAVDLPRDSLPPVLEPAASSAAARVSGPSPEWPLPAAAPGAAPPPAADAAAPESIAFGLPREVLPELPPAPAPRVDWPPDERRRILALRLVAPLPERFAGHSLRQALAAEGFVLGRFAIFHKADDEQRAVLSAASLTRPGTFDVHTMDSQRYGGLSLFAVLPGPKPPPQAFDELVFTARNLNERLHGVLQDEGGSPLTPARIAQLRERLHAGAVS
jgi:cell division protein ZipA